MPLSLRFTRSTSSACRSIVMLRWMMPMPPCCASAIARCDSVTVSIAALRIGMFSLILRVTYVLVSTWFGRHWTTLRYEKNVVECKAFENRIRNHVPG